MPDISIIIPTRGNPLGLWATVHSCFDDLRDTGLSYEFIVVSNGDPKEAHEVASLAHYLHKDSLGQMVHSVQPMTPSAARQHGVGMSSGRLLFFFDNHCVVSRDYFRRAVSTLDDFGADQVHSATRFYLTDNINYHYRLKLKYNFWGTSVSIPEHEYKPYQVAAAGHGGFALHRSVWDSIGGYGPDELFVDYGGEELSFDLKLWRYGFKNWLHPRLIHYHFAGVRGYMRHYSDEYYTNMMVSAYVVGGLSWLYKVYESFASKNHVRINAVLPMYDLLQIAEKRGREYSLEVDSKSKYSLDELLVQFKTNLVAM